MFSNYITYPLTYTQSQVVHNSQHHPRSDTACCCVHRPRRTPENSWLLLNYPNWLMHTDLRPPIWLCYFLLTQYFKTKTNKYYLELKFYFLNEVFLVSIGETNDLFLVK